VQAWAIRGAYLLSQVVSYGILATLYFKAKVRARGVWRGGGIEGEADDDGDDGRTTRRRAW
jgi:hypothetical protein